MARPFSVATLVAAGFHGLALALLPTSSPAPAPPREETPPLEVSFESDVAGPALEASPTATPPAAGVPGAPRHLARAAAIPAVVAHQEAPAVVAIPSASVVAPAWAAPGVPDAEARGKQAIAGLFRGGVWLPGAAPEAPESAPVPRREPGVDPDLGGKLLRETMDRSNQARGLGFGGPVASAAHQASLSKNAPVEGAATFDVLAGPDGVVTSVAVRSARGDWSSVVTALQALLASKRLQVPAGASGVAVAVRVEAKLQLPSGKSPGDPAVSVEFRGVGVGGTFDLADLSGKVSRIVSARIVNERRL